MNGHANPTLSLIPPRPSKSSHWCQDSTALTTVDLEAILVMYPHALIFSSCSCPAPLDPCSGTSPALQLHNLNMHFLELNTFLPIPATLLPHSACLHSCANPWLNQHVLGAITCLVLRWPGPDAILHFCDYQARSPFPTEQKKKLPEDKGCVWFAFPLAQSAQDGTGQVRGCISAPPKCRAHKKSI